MKSKFFFNNIKTSSKFKNPSVSKKYFKNFVLVKKNNNLDFKIVSNYKIKFNYFSLKPMKNYGHRFVLDIYLKGKIKKITEKSKSNSTKKSYYVLL